MKKMVLVFAAAVIAVSGAALAQESNYLNNVGVYFDEAGTNNCGVVGANQSTPAYLVFTKVTSPTILAWEMALNYENMFVQSVAVRGDAIDAAARVDEHLVGYAAPVPVVNQTFVAADIQFIVLIYQVTSPSYFFADGVYFHLMDNKVPAYLDGDNNAFELHPVNGDGSVPIMVVNGDCAPVATESDSWGNVKSLFR